MRSTHSFGSLHIAPKMAICLLRAFPTKLLTRDRLYQFGIIQTNLCPFCTLLSESNDHLFFACSFSTYIWALWKLSLGFAQQVGSIHQEAKQIGDAFNSKLKVSTLAKLTIAGAYGTSRKREIEGYLTSKNWPSYKDFISYMKVLKFWCRNALGNQQTSLIICKFSKTGRWINQEDCLAENSLFINSEICM